MKPATLVTALIAAGTLLVTGRPTTPPPSGGRVPAAQAWPGAARADLPDLTVTPLLFLDSHTVVGTLATHDGTHLRLVIEASDGTLRELHRLPADDDPQFGSVTAAAGRLVWVETTRQQPWQIWAADLAGGPAHRLVTDAGDAVFAGDQYDLVPAQGRVHWAVAADDRATQIRSVAFTGGPVEVRAEDDEWSLSAWPWLADNASIGVGTIRLRNMTTGQDVRVVFSAGELVTCTPTWCRVMVMSAGIDLARIDLMHPDGSGRRHIAGGGAEAAVTDVAVLDRFEILSEPSANSDLTGTAGLLVYDIATGRTVTISAAATGVYTHDGMLWWSTGQTDVTWHALDLRTA